MWCTIADIFHLISKTSSDAPPWTHHQCYFLESLGVSGLTTDILVQVTWPNG